MKKLSFLLALLCINLAVFGQVNTYTFAYSAGTFTPLSGGTALVPPNSGISGTGWFEQCYNVPLPFVYYFNGAGYSSCYINSNGHITFGKPSAVTNVRPHTTNNGQSGSIMGYACGSTFSYASGPGPILLGGLMDYANSNPITYGTIGTAPNRIFVVQWTSAYRTLTYYSTSGAGTDALTFQIRLKEGSNVAELVYNTSSTSVTSVNAVVGLCGASTADFNLVGGSSWTSVTNNTSTTATNIPYNASVSIPAGVTYTFTPPAGMQPTACSGVPASPTVLATTGITNTTSTLSLSGLSNSTGLTYQWQRSSTGIAGSFTNIAGATDATYTATPTAATYYQCLVACGSGTAVASSSFGLGYESSFPAIPAYTYNLMGGYPNGNIGNFNIAGTACGTSFNDVGNSVSAFNYITYAGTSGTQYCYLDYTNNVPRFKLLASTSTTTNYTASVNNNATNAGSYVVWIDFNDNGSFADAGENVGSVTGVAGAATNFTLTIPANVFGIHRMRIRGAFSAAYGTGIPPTGLISFFGQGIDYLCEITPPAPAPTTNSPLCVTGTLTLTSPALTGATYTWTGPLSYYATTTSTSIGLTAGTTTVGGTYTLYTTVDGANACSPTTTSVTVNLQPSLTGASNSGPVCQGTTLNLSANGAANVTGYSWTGPVGVTSATSATASVPAAPLAAAGTYTVAVNNGTGSACTVNYTTTASITPAPDASVLATAAGPACVGSGTPITITSSSLGAGTFTVNYSTSGANTFTSQTATLVVSGGSGTFTTVSMPSTGATNIVINSLTNVAGCVTNLSTGNTATYTVNALPSAISGTTVVCAGLSTTLSDAGGGTWSSSNTAIATAASTTGVITGVSGGTVTITYTLPNTCLTTTTYTVNQTPAITGVAGTCVSNTTTLSDIASGGTWTSNNISVATIGATTGIVTGVSLGTALISYTLPSTGCSAVQVVTITSPPSLFSVTGGGNYCSGGTLPHVNLSGSTVGVGYQLYIGGVPTGSPVSGTGFPLDFGGQSVAGTYTVVANPGTSCAATMTGSVSIGTYSTPVAFTVTGGGAYCAGGTGVNIYLSGSATSVSYQLFNGGGTSGTPVTGTTAVLDFGPRTAAGTYTVFATNTVTGCTNAMLGSVTVSVNPLPTQFNVIGGGNYCAGGSGMPVGIFNSTTGVNYQLFRGGVPVGAPVAGSTGLPISFGNQTAGTYTVVGTNAATGCSATMTGSVTVTITALPTLYSVTGGGAFCAGGTGVHIGLNGSATGVNYQLYNTGTATGVPLSGTGSALDFGVFTTTGNYTVVASIPSTTCANNMIGSVNVTINPSPNTFGLTGGGNYCAGTGGVHIGLNGSVIGTNYYLYNGSTVVGGASGTGSPVDFGLLVPAGTYTVSGTVASTGCGGNMTGSVTVGINPLPLAFIVSGGGSYCAGTPAPHVLLNNSTSGVTYQLLLSGTPVGAAVNGTGGGLDFGAQTAAGTYTVLATITATGCMSTMSGSAVITINALPSGYNVTGGGNFCTGGTGVRIGLNGSDAGVSYQLRNGLFSVGAPVTGTGLALDFGLQTTPTTYTVIATNVATGCLATMPGSATIGLNALPNVYTVSGGGNYCAGGAGNHIFLNSSESGVNYQLYNGLLAVGAAVGGSGLTLDFGSLTTAGTYTVKATNGTTGCTSIQNGSATIGITPLPNAYAVTGGGSYCAGGGGLHLGLANSAVGVNYLLYNTGVAVGASVAGSGAALDFGVFTATGAYTVVATDVASTCTNLMTGGVNIAVNALPAVHNVTGGGTFACAGGPGAHVGLDGSEAGYSYQMYRDGILSGAPLAGTGVALDFGLQTISGNYTVVATNTATGCVRTMPGGAVIVISGLPFIHVVTGGGNYCPGTPGTHIGLDGSDPGVNYQLYFGTLATNSPVGGSGSAIDLGVVSSAGNYTVQATNATTGCISTMAGTATVGVAALPVAYNVTGGGYYCASGTGVHVMLDGSNTGISYALYKNSVITSTILTGTGSPLDFGLQTGGVYTVLAKNIATTCSNNMNGSATVVTNGLPGAHVVGGGGMYCAGGAGKHVTLDASETGITYRLYTDGVVTGSPVAGTGAALDFGLQTAAGSYTVVATNAITGCTNNMTGGSAIGINPLPTLYSVTGGGSYCASGTGIDIVLSGSTSGITYQLYQDTTPTGVPLYGTGSWLDFGMQTAAGNYTVHATDNITGCATNMGGTATVTVLPQPASYNVAGGGAFCAGGAGVGVTLSGSVSGATYKLLRDGLPTSVVVAGTGAALDFGLQTVSGTYTVEATNTTTGCTKIMNGFAAVDAGITPTAFTVSGSSTTGYCVGGTGVTVYLSNSESGINYQLYRGITPVGTPFAGTGGALSFGPQAVVGTYTIVGRSVSAGCTTNMTGSVVVSINPLPLTFDVTGGGGYCAGTPGVDVSLSSSSVGISYQLMHNGLPIGLPVVGTGSALDMGVQSAEGNYTVVGSTSGSGCSVNMSGSANVHINAGPATFTVTGGGSFCAGATGAHIGLSGSATGVTYQLNRGLSTVGAPIAGTGSALDFGLQTISGLYTVTATSLSTGCARTMTAAATVTAIPLPAPHAVTGGGSYCAGGTGVHIGTDGSNAGVVYRLYNGSTLVGLPVTGTGFGLDFGLKTAAGSYTVIAMDATTSCIANMPGSATVGINAAPDVFAVTGGGNYCAGTPGTHVGLSGSTSGITYSLYSGSSLAGSYAGTGTMLDFGLQTGAGTYLVQAVNSATGCSSNMAGSAVIGVTPVTVPSVTITSATGDTVCAGVLTTFSASGSNGGIAPAYEWRVNGVVTGTASAYSYVPVDGDIVTVAYTSSASCATPAMVTDHATIAVLPKEVPAVAVSANPGIEVCQGNVALFSAIPTYGGTSPSYIWLKGTTVMSAGPTYSYVPADGDVITCKMTSNYRCRLANQVSSNPVTVIVDTPGTPVVTITAYPGTHIAAGEAATLVATVTKGGAAPTYSWAINGVVLSGATSPTLVYSNFENGDVVTCNILSSGGCSGIPATSSVTMRVSNVGVANAGNVSDDIRLVPNPSNGTFTIKGAVNSLAAAGNGVVNIDVVNMVGQLVYSNSINVQNGILNEKVQMGANLPNGMYLLNLRTGTENKVFHLVIEQ